MTTLTTVSCLNPFFLDGRKVNNIIFYNDEGILFETHRGWFGVHNNPFKTLEVGDVKVRRVTALNKMDKKENFCVSVKAEYSNDKEYDLYLYVDGKDIAVVNEVFKEEQFGNTQIRKYVVRTIKLYDLQINLEETLSFEKTDFGNKVAGINNELKELGININGWELETLLKHYDLVKK